MGYANVLKQSWHILWRYRVLWIFGFILSMTSVSWWQGLEWDERWDEGQGLVIRSIEGRAVLPGPNLTIDLRPVGGAVITFPELEGGPVIIRTGERWTVVMPPELKQDLRELADGIDAGIPPDVGRAIAGSLLAILAVIAVAWLVATVARYVSEAALIHAVDQHAKTGEKAGFRDVLRMGWSRTAWRFFLIDLAVRLPLAVFFVALLLLALAPLLLGFSGDPEALVVGILASAALLWFILILAIFVSLLLGLLTNFFRRVCALEGLGVTASVVRGFQMVWHHPKDVIVMALLLLMAIVGAALLSIPLLIILVPVFLACVFAGLVVGAAVFFPVAGLAHLFLADVVAWVLAGSVALAVFIPIVIAPAFFVWGLVHVYGSSTWTLTYRELRALEKAGLEPLPKEPLLAKA